MKAIRRFTVRTVLPGPLAPLSELALNLRWSWHRPTRDLFEQINPELWQTVGKDPVALLSELTSEDLRRLSQDEELCRKVQDAAANLHHYLNEDRWFQSLPDAPASIAYFSPEYGITSVLPQYSGGLGILAGDHLKSASDLGVPIVGVGLLYSSGYFKQALTREGWQTETYPISDPDGLPLTLLREPDGRPCLVKVELPGSRTLGAYIWKADVGRVPLLLLDSDVPENDDQARVITDRLYGGGGEHRLQQEMLLGIGGVRALRIWARLNNKPAPEVYHTNEGHAGFLGLERVRELMTAGLTYDEARQAVRAATVFTTHTPVPAGIDRFPADLARLYLGGSEVLKPLEIDRLMSLGAENFAGGDPGVFNMAVMGLRMAQRANGVSQLHGKVSRHMFEGLWPGFDDEEVPITSITNGVHAPTWVHRSVVEAAINKTEHEVLSDPAVWERARQADSGEVWAIRRQMRSELVDEVRRRMHDSWLARGRSGAELGWTSSIFDPDVLTIGFARRVPTYKRLTLMLRDPERLKGLLLHPTRPIQLVVAGKSHPADEQGKRLIQQLVQFADAEDVRHRIAFLPNYDIAMAQSLYPGCDVWLNNPLRPLEACGTSGMKAALNGGLNLSILDGWWDEWFDGENGWAIPTADGVTDPDRRDDLEAAALYDLIEQQVAPRFYDHDENGIPQRWTNMIRHTLSTLGPKVLATRMVSEYVEKLYVPAASSGRRMLADDYEGARQLAAWKYKVRRGWTGVHVDHVESSGLSDVPQVGETLHVSAFLSLGDLAPEDVLVQVVHGRVTEADEILGEAAVPLKCTAKYEGGRVKFEGEVPLSRTGSFGYTVRVLPWHEALIHTGELGLVANA